MDRIRQFAPSILLALALGGIVFIYVKLVSNHYKDRLKSLEYAKANKLKMALLVGTPTTIFLAPLTEEVVFRAPLLLLFDHLSENAWLGVSISALLFGGAHWRGTKIDITDIPEKRANGEAITDDTQAELELAGKEHARRVLISKILHVILTTPLGLAFGYYGVKHQSLWLCIALHAGWNLIGYPVYIILSGVLTFIGAVIYTIGELVVHKILTKLKKYRRTKNRKNQYTR